MPRSRFVLALALAISRSAFLEAQVVVNEFSAANRTTIQAATGEYEDWIELYNAGPLSVDLSGYHLSDRANNPAKWTFPGGVILAPGAQLLVFASGEDGFLSGQWHTNFKITQTDNKEAVVLADPVGNVLDMHDLDIPNQKNHSWARFPDGGPWMLDTSPTPGQPNSADFLAYAEVPTADLDAGYYPGPVNLTLSTTQAGTIRWTNSGQEPTVSSAIYSGPLNINQTLVLKWKLFPTDPNLAPSATETNTYFIGPDQHQIKVVSISGDNLPTLLGGMSISPEGTFELFSESGKFLDEASGDFNRHGKDSWAYAQRGIDYITRDQLGIDDEIHYPLFALQDRQKFQRIILKAAANDNYPFIQGAHIRDAYVHELAQRAGMNLDVRSYEPCILYVNGLYWGVYEIREKVDDKDFVEHYYGLNDKQFDFIKTWGGTWAEYGSMAGWNTLRSYILSNDMADPMAFQYVADRLDLLSLADYFIINVHTVCKDWLNWNTAWWGGNDGQGHVVKWRYTLWDLDATFGHYINYTSIPNIGPTADPCDIETLPNSSDPQNHIDVLMKLFDNPGFRDLYLNRYADLNNTALSCPSMIALLDELLARIEPEMPRQIARWGGSLAEWNVNVQKLKDFILSRCVEIEDGLTDCYDLTGPHELTVIVMPQGSPNQVRINTLQPGSYPFQGKYYGGTQLAFSAVPDPDWTFVRWVTDSLSLMPDDLFNPVSGQLNGPDTLWAFFQPVCQLGMEILPPAKTVLDCHPEPVRLQGVAYDGHDPYIWTWTDSSGTILQAGSSDTLSVSQPGWVFLAVTDTVAQCTRTDSLYIADKRDYPIPAWQPPAKLTCLDSTVLLDASASGTAAIVWSGPCVDGPTTFLTTSVSCPGWYVLTLTNPMSGCTATDSLEILDDHISPQDIGLSSTSDTLPCTAGGIMASLTGTGLAAGYTYLWTTQTGEIQGDPTGSDCQVLKPGLYVVRITDPENGCAILDTFHLLQASPLDLTVQLDITPASCPEVADGQVEVVSIVGGSEPYAYSWSGSPAVPDSLFTQAAAGPLLLSISDQYFCTWDTVLTVPSLPPATFDVLPSPASCGSASDGRIQVANVQGAIPPYQYTLMPGNVAGNPPFTDLVPGEYTLVLGYASGCSTGQPVTVNVAKDPDFNITLNGPTCADAANGTILVEPLGGTPPWTYLLDGTMMSQGNAFTGLMTGAYLLEATDLSGCTWDTLISLDKGTPPLVDLGADRTVDAGESVLVSPVTQGTGLFWEWPGYDCPGCPVLSLVVESDTLVVIRVTDDGGCIATDSLYLYAVTSGECYLPTAFSPNGDGINDHWLPIPRSASARVRELNIFDRWGNQVFGSVGPEFPEGWDGLSRGKPCMTGVYVFQLVLETSPGQNRALHGEILLMR